MAVAPLASWVGGKYQLSKKIIPLIPPHTCYVEPFAGAAWVFFKKAHSEVEVLNDINSDVVTLYRVVKLHLEEFIRYFKWVLVARDEFERFTKEQPETLTDIQRAVRFFYLQKMSFGGHVTHRTFGTATTRTPRLNLLRIEEDLSAAHLRLSQVYIENLNYLDLIARYDCEHSFFYIDPPYWNCEDYYGKNIFDKTDFEKLADKLKTIKGQFLLSLNDVPEIRDIFKDFTIETTEVTYSCGISRNKASEVFIRNY